MLKASLTEPPLLCADPAIRDIDPNVGIDLIFSI